MSIQLRVYGGSNDSIFTTFRYKHAKNQTIHYMRIMSCSINGDIQWKYIIILQTQKSSFILIDAHFTDLTCGLIIKKLNSINYAIWTKK